MKKYNNFKELVIDEIKYQLNNYKECKMYSCDMPYQLLEKYNIDCTYTYNTYESKEIIKRYFDDLGEIYEEYLFQCGEENAINPFEEPEKFVVCMLLESASYLLSQCDFIDKNWNNEIVLTKENIKTISNQLLGVE